MLIRVKKQDIQPANYAKRDPLDECLECWKIYINGDGDRDLKTKTQHGLMGLADAYGISTDEAQQAADMRIGAATDAMIDSMKRIHIWAIYNLCSVATPWKYPNADIIIIGQQAKEELEKKLRINVATSVLF